MASPFQNAADKIKEHPILATVIIGGLGIAATLYVAKNKSSNSTTANTSTQSVCTDSNGDVVDCNTGLPIGTSGGFSLQPSNNNSDVLTGISNLGLQIQNLVAALANGNSGATNNPPSNPPPNNPPPIPPRPIPPAPQIPPKPILPPGPSGGVNPPKNRTVTVATWSSTHTPWNSTLWGIATHFGESLSTIEKLNPQIKNPNLIYPGQRVNY